MLDPAHVICLWCRHPDESIPVAVAAKKSEPDNAGDADEPRLDAAAEVPEETLHRIRIRSGLFWGILA